jgi:hypothetical protein
MEEMGGRKGGMEGEREMNAAEWGGCGEGTNKGGKETTFLRNPFDSSMISENCGLDNRVFDNFRLYEVSLSPNHSELQ